MKKFLPIGILLASSLFSACDLSTQSQDASGTRTVSARVGRAADVANSVWSRTVWVRVNVSTTGKDTLKDTLVAFSAGGCPSVAAPVGDSVVVTLLGLSSDSDTALWYGSDTLLPGTRDTVDSITVHGASLPLPKLDSTSVVPWGVDTFDRPVRVHLSIPTLSRLVSNAVLRYTLDGSVPTEASLPYPDSGILVDSTRRVVSAVFGSLSGSLQRGAILSLPVVLKARPVSFSATGSWAPFSVVLSCATAGTVIHYTTDGSVPTPASPVFSAGLPYARFSDSVRYKAIAVDTLHPAVAPSAVDSQSVASIAPWNDTDTVSYGTLTDARDGQSYRTVKIGTRTWMAENLNHATDSSWCYQGDTAECTRYGRLYQW